MFFTEGKAAHGENRPLWSKQCRLTFCPSTHLETQTCKPVVYSDDPKHYYHLYMSRITSVLPLSMLDARQMDKCEFDWCISERKRLRGCLKTWTGDRVWTDGLEQVWSIFDPPLSTMNLNKLTITVEVLNTCFQSYAHNLCKVHIFVTKHDLMQEMTF